jgi:hypothetical protein
MARKKKAKKAQWKVVSKAAGTKGKGKLKKGCKYGRGRYKGKILCMKK